MTQGHNSISAEQLRNYILRIERVNEERKTLGEDLKELYTEVRSAGFDTKAIRALVKRRAADQDKLAEHEALIETYERALGDYKSTPLGNAAMDRARG